MIYSGHSNGWGPSNFYDVCSGKGRTITLIKCKNGRLCGAYSSMSWKKDGKWYMDKEMFLFSIDKQKIIKSKGIKKDFYGGDKNWGPLFFNAGIGL